MKVLGIYAIREADVDAGIEQKFLAKIGEATVLEHGSQFFSASPTELPAAGLVEQIEGGDAAVWAIIEEAGNWILESPIAVSPEANEAFIVKRPNGTDRLEDVLPDAADFDELEDGDD